MAKGLPYLVIIFLKLKLVDLQSLKNIMNIETQRRMINFPFQGHNKRKKEGYD